jgi:hypothetical protein
LTISYKLKFSLYHSEEEGKEEKEDENAGEEIKGAERNFNVILNQFLTFLTKIIII